MFITGLEEGLFPHEHSMTDLDGLEEERRLMYVAITRARQRLYLLQPDAHAARPDALQRQGRFLDELPDAALKWLTPRNQGFGSGFAREYQQAWSAAAALAPSSAPAVSPRVAA